MRRYVIALLAVAAAASCAYHLEPVPVAGPTRSVMRLVGVWEGQYETTPPDRGGTIAFRLRAGADTAYGDVAMASGASMAPSNSNESQFGVREASPARLPLLLAISFVQVQGAGVEGRLNSYLDPDIGDRVTTRFRGAFTTDSTLEGTFATRDMWGEIVRQGKWSAVRTRVP